MDKEYIEREALRDELYYADAITMKGVAMINQFPAADVREVVHGKWVKLEDFDEYGGGRYVEWHCSECYHVVKTGWAVRDKNVDEKPKENFCPNCGADMREG